MAGKPLKGSERKPLPGARAVGKADPTERLEVSVMLHRRNADAFAQRATRIMRRGRAGGHLSREEFEQQFGADNDDIDAWEHFGERSPHL